MRKDWWRLVVLVGIVGGVGEGLLAIADPFVVVFSAIFFLGAALAYRRKLTGVVLIGLLSLIEVVFLPFYSILANRRATGSFSSRSVPLE